MASALGKEVVATIRLVVNAGSAKPAPPVGPALGQAGLNIMAFCKEFNAKTADYQVRARRRGERARARAPGASCPGRAARWPARKHCPRPYSRR